MPPKKSGPKHGLGRALMNHRAKTKAADDERELHSTDVYDNKPISVTQESDLDAFLNTATLAGTSFVAERQNVSIVNPTTSTQNPYLLTATEQSHVTAKHRAHAQQLRVPRRPPWDSRTTAAQLERQERDSFLEWRRGLAGLTDRENLLLTPFERNLEVWRQLWRVLERSQLVVQIVDARNPLRFRCEDLETYVDELVHHFPVDEGQDGPAQARRRNLLLLNKADLLTLPQRAAWARYFDSQNVNFAFFSAKAAATALEAELESQVAGLSAGSDGSDQEEAEHFNDEVNVNGANDDAEGKETRILTTAELENLFFANAPPSSSDDAKLTVGLVGYPNVGKSSTINALIGAKKVSVSATPGKTKHFQTINLSPDVTLCDCPGLVFPQFASTRAELVCDGVLPIDQMREFTGPCALLAQRIPKQVVEATYGITVHVQPVDEGGTGVPTAPELLSSYARARGFYTGGSGQPDESRAARILLKDYVNARLLFCHPPPLPDLNAAEFNADSVHAQLQRLAEERPARLDEGAEPPSPPSRPGMPEPSRAKELDRTFFASEGADSRTMVAGRRSQGVVGSDGSVRTGQAQGAPVPSGKKHFKGRRGGAAR